MTNPTNHQCLNGRRCQLGDTPATTEKPNTLCHPCTARARQHITRLPQQHAQLHAMIGDHDPTINARHTQPHACIPINLAVDTLIGRITHHTHLAAEIITDHLHCDPPPPHDVTKCSALIGLHLPVLLAVTDIDVLVWNRAGTRRTLDTTTGVAIIQHLDHLSEMARYTLGQTRTRAYRDIPCARCTARTVGRWTGADAWDCETCGATFAETDIRRYDRILLERHRRGLLHA